ncbi:MAG: TlpA family protein disulfide reductase [Leptospiraceae bacterium]|nr:TlpA family protein disulfide reductase [Leptospiraceae bacterium]MCP5495575.1 TlpA family protein disulfide reductase [Leptospiraceae bacterium]
MKRTIVKYVIFFTFFFALTLSIAYARASKKKFTLDYKNFNYIQPGSYEGVHWDSKNKVIYIWAVWCGVCKANLPILKFNNQLFGKVFNISFISVEEGSTGKIEINRYIQNQNINFPVILGNEDLLKRLDVNSFPTTIFINSKDEVLFVDSGIINPISYFLRMLFTNLF